MNKWNPNITNTTRTLFNRLFTVSDVALQRHLRCRSVQLINWLKFQPISWSIFCVTLVICWIDRSQVHLCSYKIITILSRHKASLNWECKTAKHFISNRTISIHSDMRTLCTIWWSNSHSCWCRIKNLWRWLCTKISGAISPFSDNRYRVSSFPKVNSSHWCSIQSKLHEVANKAASTVFLK